MSPASPLEPQLRLLERQFLFARLLARLLDRAHELGFDVTLGEAWRSLETARVLAAQGKGSANTLHAVRLAVDLNLFRGGHYCRETEDHRPLGEWWESQHELCAWGGRFSRPDGNHYSLRWDGRA
jgi:hypothetical protein